MGDDGVFPPMHNTKKISGQEKHKKMATVPWIDANALVAAVRDAKDVETQREASHVLWNDACDRANKLMDAGVATALAMALREWDDVWAKESCVRAIGCLAKGKDDCKTTLADAGMLELLVAILPCNDAGMGSSAAWALSWMTADNPEVTQQLRDVPDVLEALEVAEGHEKNGSAKDVLDRLRLLSSRYRRVKPVRA